MKIMENLWQVGGAEFTTVEDAAIYLVEFGPMRVLFGQDVYVSSLYLR